MTGELTFGSPTMTCAHQVAVTGSVQLRTQSTLFGMHHRLVMNMTEPEQRTDRQLWKVLVVAE